MHGGKLWQCVWLAALTACLGCTSGGPRLLGTWGGWGAYSATTASREAPPPPMGEVRRVNHEETMPSDAPPPASSPAPAEDRPSVVQSTTESVTRWFTGGKKPPSTESEKRDGQRLYDEAETLFREGAKLAVGQREAKFAEAEPKYAAAAAAWRDSAVEENGLFGVAECRFFCDRFDAAELAYEELIKQYPNTRHLDVVSSRRFAIAQFWFELAAKESRFFLQPNITDQRQPQYDTYGSAIKILERIRLDDPTGKLADDATMLAGNSCFKSGNWYDADHYYDDLRKNFPDSPHQFQAHLLGVQCKLRLYQGSDYEASPLAEAEKLVKSMNRQFPQESVKEKEYLDRVFKEIRLKKAQAEWDLAAYYDRKGEYRAAQYHYERVAKSFSDTNLAEESRKRITEIAGKPPVPPDRFAWLSSMLRKQEDDIVAPASPNAPAQPAGDAPVQRR